ncbi:Rad3-related DNA helicase-like protein (plasmid) [Thioalkalivibrio sp. K90mix]|uniref:helicase C-terminal domain-containing protein n=1 Tax=Thioalkalivibrio sp. (strain K90mix) TaxID=396595 RepID=UPI000195A44C|nr:helicase C-terminal domain-containing protein [Thioalkalivibrio sp. K90mix]ADC73185.1 Rad3-related DNA helicase-like protein [Thioalkalivibrio sp. K90mix]
MQIRLKYSPERLTDIPATGQSRFFRERLHAAAHTARRRRLPAVGLDSISINLGARDLAVLSGLRQGDEPWSEVLSELLHGHLNQPGGEPRSKRTEAADRRAEGPDWMRPEQGRFYAPLAEGLAANAILLAEAATGTGKGRAVAQAVEDALAAGRERVVVCGPTLGVLAALAREFGSCPGLNRPMQFFLGAAQFFHAGRARQLASLMQSGSDPETQASGSALLQWLDAGAPAGRTDSTAAFASVEGQPVSHLTDDLATLLPDGYGVEELELSAEEIGGDAESETDPGIRAAMAARDLEGDAPIVFCTHAMYALHARMIGLERYLLPPHEVLVLDEAHQFEENANAVLSPTASLDQLPRLLRSLPAALLLKTGKRDLEAVEEVLKDLHNRFPERGGEILLFPGDDRYAAVQVQAGRLHQAVDALIGRAERARQHTADPGLLALLKRTRSILRASQRERALLQLSSSPVRGYLSLAVGGQGLRRLFERMWSQVDAAVLMSATLYVPTRDSRRADVSDTQGWYSARHLTQVLALPRERLRTLKPVRPDWVRGNVIAHIERNPERRPPSTSETDPAIYAALVQQWLDDTARDLARITEGAEQGTLVLLTAYRDIEGLSERLADTLGERLIAQGPGARLSALREAFVASSRNGERPVWLATGAAWTGINLTSEGLSQVSDLVIARLPVGLNRSISQAARNRGRANFESKAAETYWQTAQGIGRMVRSEQDTDRHLWVLDPRAVIEPLYTPVRLLLESYRVSDGPRDSDCSPP